MKRLMAAGCCAAVLLCAAGCGESSAGSSETAAEGLTVHASEDMDAAYTECVKRYFEAVERHDYEAYCAVMYPPYLEAYQAYLKEQGSTNEEAFDGLCSRFDEDGYESWTLTELELSYYPQEKVDLDGFFERYSSAGVFDEGFGERCKKEAEEIRDLQFTLYALYAGDDEAVPVVRGNEMIAVKTSDGVYVFG